MRTSFHHWMWCSLLLLSPILSQAQTLSATQDSSDAYIDVSWEIPVDPCLLDNQQRYKEVSLQLKADDDRGIIEEIKFNDLAQFYGPPQPIFETVFQGSSAEDGLIFEFEKDNFIQQINNYTVEFWVKLNANTNIANLLENRGGTGFLQIEKSGADYRIQIKDGQDSQATGISGFPIQAEKWHHLAFAANGLGNTLVYVDGRFEAVIKNKIPLANFYKIATGTAFQFAEFRLWDRIRTNEEIRSNYTSTRSDQNNLVILLKATADEIRAGDNNTFAVTSMDLATLYDKQTQNFTSNTTGVESVFVPYVPTPEYQPITGVFRDQVGANKAIGYTLELEVSGTSNPNANAACSPLEIVGTTLPYQQPNNTTVSQDLINRINISWQHNSDWVARYVVRRTDVENRSVDIPVSISNFNKGQVYTFSDQFSLNNNRSIVNGENYRYALVGFGLNNEELVTNLGQGESIPIDLQASDAGQSNGESVRLQWNDISAYADLIEVHRNGEVLVQLNPSETTFEDNDPIAGSELNYELRLFKNGQVLVSDFDKGSVPPNGVITGKIVTRSGEFPVKGVDVKLTATNSNLMRTVTTDEQGIFTFADLVYGLVDTFTLEAQPLPLHQYSPNNQLVVLSKTQPISEETVIFDAFTYNTGFAQIDITQFALRPAPMEDAMDIFWNINSSASNVFIEIIRDGQLIYQDVSGNDLQGSFKDLTGAPEKQYQYTLKAYQIDGDLENNPNSTRLTSKTQTATGVFPDVASVPNFSAVPNDNQGFVTLNWAHTSDNASGYRLFRDDELIAEVTADLNEFEDRYGEPSAVTTYKIVAFRTIEDLTTESEANESTLIFFPSLPTPQNVSINSNGLMPSLKVSWTAAANDDFNFIGYRVYRMEEGGDAALIATIFKDRQLEWTDLQGISGTTYAYQIKSFIEAPDGTIYESEAATSAALAFPALATPSDFQVSTNTQKSGSRTGLTTINYTWEYPTQVSNFDSFILYGNNDLPLDTLNPQARSSTFLMNENAANSFKISAFRIINKVGYTSNLATATIDANEEEIANINLAQPRNFTASTDVLTHIKLCWENETLSDKRIYRDGELIAEVNNDVESYYDYDAVFGQDYFYEIEGIQDGQMSLKVAAFGSLLNAKKVSGRVYNGKTDIGIANALIRLETTDNQYKQAFTDATGYYEIPSFSAVLSEAMTLTAQHSNLTNGSLSKSIIINATQDNYDLDFVDNNDDPIRFDTVATITSLLATPDR
ncbi:MAG: LamG-like jellyroll fold domain-containing protein, partial [Bacteroidota bacterium]